MRRARSRDSGGIDAEGRIIDDGHVDTHAVFQRAQLFQLFAGFEWRGFRG